MKKLKTSLFALAAASPLAGPLWAQEGASFCETGFVLADVDGDGVLDASEAEALFTTEFNAIDADGDDALSPSEYRECLGRALGAAAVPRNIDAEGSGELGPSGVEVEFQTDEDGAITREAYMQAARLAYDGTGNQEDNQVEWARAFVFLGEDEADADVREMSRDEYAARAAILFRRLDTDADGRLSTEEWTAQDVPQQDQTEALDARFERMDEDSSGDVTREEYVARGEELLARAGESARLRGWDGTADASTSAGLDVADDAEVTDDGVTTDGLAGEGSMGTVADVATAGEAGGDEAADETAEADDAVDSPVTRTVDGEDAGVPAFDYRFEQDG